MTGEARILAWLDSEDAADLVPRSDAREIRDAIAAGRHLSWNPDEEERRLALDEIEGEEHRRAHPYRGPPVTTASIAGLLAEYGATLHAQANTSAPLIGFRVLRG